MTPHTAGSTLVLALLLMCTNLTATAGTVASPASQTVEFSPQQPQTPPATMVGNDGAEMILVPGGEFIMGSDADEIARLAIKQALVEDEMPRHRVYLDTFYMDKYEVTNAHFQQFVHATGYRTQAEREDCNHGEARRHPQGADRVAEILDEGFHTHLVFESGCHVPGERCQGRVNP